MNNGETLSREIHLHIEPPQAREGKEISGDLQKPRTLRESVAQALDSYFEHLDGQPVTDLYDLVLAEIEAPLLECALRESQNNQSRCATMLGLNRGTLRKKLKKYGLL